jgi:hypothetical protein
MFKYLVIKCITVWYYSPNETTLHSKLINCWMLKILAKEFFYFMDITFIHSWIFIIKFETINVMYWIFYIMANLKENYLYLHNILLANDAVHTLYVM